MDVFESKLIFSIVTCALTPIRFIHDTARVTIEMFPFDLRTPILKRSKIVKRYRYKSQHKFSFNFKILEKFNPLRHLQLHDENSSKLKLYSSDEGATAKKSKF